jgi:hypothetical protein
MVNSITWPDGSHCDFQDCQRCLEDCDIKHLSIALAREAEHKPAAGTDITAPINKTGGNS